MPALLTTGRCLVAGACLYAFLAAETLASTSGPSRPNVLLMLIDDLGWRDAAVYGSSFYRTPNIDRLAARGLRFTNAYAANPLCSPTRASILTGQYPARLRFTTPAGHLPQVVLDPKIRTRAPPDRKVLDSETCTRLKNEYYTLAEAFRDNGYRTGFLGKWHLGRDPYLPENQGFELNLGGAHYPGPPSYFSPYGIHNLPDGPEGEHISDRLSREAVRFMRRHRKEPFFLCYWDYSVHAPYQARPDLVAKYRELVDADSPQRNPIMGGMIESMDDAVGTLLDGIDDLGLAGRTILVFTSDNGGNMYDLPGGTTPTNNSPLRGGKAMIYEGGIRVPLIVVWPGVTTAGATSEAIVSTVDWYPTLVAMTGIRPAQEVVLDGTDITPALRGGQLRHDLYFCHYPHYMGARRGTRLNYPSTALRKGEWKLIRFHFDGPAGAHRHELYDLEHDIGETRNLAEDRPDLVRELGALMDRHLAETGALLPRPNPRYGQLPPELAGWSGNRHAVLAMENGRLVIESTGGDPYLTCTDVPPAPGPGRLELRMRSGSRGRGQIFWSTPASGPFHRSRATVFDVRHDNRWHEYSVEIRNEGPLTRLRIDPSTAAGRMEIEWIRLVDAGGHALKTWRFGTEE